MTFVVTTVVTRGTVTSDLNRNLGGEVTTGTMDTGDGGGRAEGVTIYVNHRDITGLLGSTFSVDLFVHGIPEMSSPPPETDVILSRSPEGPRSLILLVITVISLPLSLAHLIKINKETSTGKLPSFLS